jgi:predicted transposase/invertase (TIGR01784 family)
MDDSTKSIARVHDKFFRDVMSDLRIAREFFALHLPPRILNRINLATLELQPCSYFNVILDESILDLVYKADIVDWGECVYFIVEHQSTPDKWMPLRMQIYTTHIIDRHFKNSGGKSVPLVYGMVVYHGAQPYPYFTDIHSIVNAPYEMIGEDFLKSSQLIELGKMTDEKLKGSASIGVVEFFLKHINEIDFLPFLQEIMDNLSSLEQSGYGNIVSSVLKYALRRGEISDKESFFNLIKSRFTADVGGNVMTLGEQLVNSGLQQGLQKGLQEGLQKGLEEGLIKGKLEVAERLLAEGADAAFVSKITGLPLVKIKELESTET